MMKHALQVTGLAATRTLTRETELGGESWDTWLQLLTMATMGKDATCPNSTSDVGLRLKLSQESSYMQWVTVMWLDFLCISLASRNTVVWENSVFNNCRTLKFRTEKFSYKYKFSFLIVCHKNFTRLNFVHFWLSKINPGRKFPKLRYYIITLVYVSHLSFHQECNVRYNTNIRLLTKTPNKGQSPNSGQESMH